MLQLAEELGINATLNMTVPSIKIAITNSEDNWANLKSATQIAELFDNYEDVRKVNSKPMDRWGRNDKILTYSGIKEKENRFGKTSPRLGASVPESTRERTFEKRVIQRCYHCNMPGHIKAGCPKLIKNKTTETLNNIEGNENPDFLNSYTTKGSVNGHEIDILRDTGATIDLVCAKYINPSSFSGENVWVKQPLSPELVCLPLAVVEISGNFGTVQTKAAVCGNHLNQHGRYLLGNKTAELIKGNLGYNFLPVEILNAVQTRSQVKAAREERGIDSGDAKKGKMRVTRENLINAQNSEEIKPLYEQAASQVQVTNQVYSLEKELLVKNREDKLGNVVKLIVVPEKLRDPIKSLCHEGTSAHLGITKSKDKLNRYFYWPNCYRDMEQFVKTCDQCQRAGKPNDKKKAPLKLVPVIREVFTKLNIDACGPLPITSKGNRYLITAICMSSKFPEAIPVSDISSCSDYRVFERFGILVRHSSVYHPQSNPVERFHRTLKRLLRVLCLDAGSEWDKHLPSILLALRTVSHESTGYTPSELVYGKNLRTPETLVMEHWMEPEEEGDLVTEYMFKLINRLKRCQEVAINKMEEMQVKRKTWYDKNAVKREFKDGDLVLVLATSRANKLAVQWIGPGTILNKISETNYLVEIPGRRETSQIYHINMLKPYYKRPEHVNASELNKHLHDKQMDRLRELLNKYSKCFSNNPGLTNLVEHEIQLVSDQPVRTKPYRMSHRQNEILKNEINRMLKLGIIEVGESDYMSPMILVEIAGKEPRPCIDYRKLNGIIRTEYFPLPNIEERVEKVSAAKFITVFDLSKGYWQIPLSKTAQRYAAFCTSFGTYRPLRMSFGLKNAPYFFSKLMAELLNGLEDFVVPYLDDIAIFSDTWESHIKHMETVLQRIKRAKLTIKPSKCKFAQQNVKFLGHIVGQGFRTPSEIKVQAVLEFPTPRTKTQIRAFLGIAGYYQKYINLFSVIAAPLTDALKGRAKKGEIKWTTECENAFRELKGKLIDKPVLYAPNFEREFIVQTDASNAGMGAVLTQLTEQGEEHPILYLSKKFSEVEKRYCTTEKECASIVFAIKRLHYYLDGNSFLVMTDHNPLVWLNRNVSSNPRLMRWALALQPYNFRIVHRSGKSHKNADSLSRSVIDN
ncbi:retrovirus-related Pol polyprotein from transposon 297 [Trichonephila clavipes]|uniref:RNA-directed DNA polymerase n=4 Tax=Trichonephila clavipes TaxID=2585209 RepID=A0A8X6VXA7_TRICX|nr:retrovirus-related Pol polyprotein from transposon 297 [Trichonephila clavipes]